MSNESCNHDVSMELVFDATKTSGQMKFLGLSERANESGNGLAGLFDWTCQACHAVNRDAVAVKPQEVFVAQWTCRSCSRVTAVQFPARTMAEWIAQHTLVVAGRRLSRRKRMVLAWVAVPVLVVVLLWMVLEVRRVRSSSAAPQTSADPAAFVRTPGSAPSGPSGRIVGYWISERRDHVLCFSPVDPVQRTGTYSLVYRGDNRGTAVPFKILHEEVDGEQLVVRKQTASNEGVVVKHQGDEIAYRVQSDAADVTFNVAKDGKSMTCLDVRDGEPVVTTYFNAGD